MFQNDRKKMYWVSSEELGGWNNPPEDDELQDLIPSLLKSILGFLWADRIDWYFGVNMKVYSDPEQPPIVPNGFLSLGVNQYIEDEDLRVSYVIWEKEQIPIFALEVISTVHKDEFTKKMEKYAEIGILYYAVYSAPRRRKPPLSVFRLVDGVYELLPENPVWLPEIGLGIGLEEGTYYGITRDWLYWYNQQGQRFLTPQELAREEQQLRHLAEQRVERLMEKLRELGVDPASVI